MMRHFFLVFLVAVVVTAVVANANHMELDDPLTPPPPMDSDGQMELDDPLTPPPPTNDDEPQSDEADSRWIEWAQEQQERSNLEEGGDRIHGGDMMLTEEQARELGL